jgi:two-component system chemotaxis sensor kinase CheA
MSQFYQAFFEEADELLAQTEHLLLAIDIESPDQDHLDAIFRAAHSIKGGAATFGFHHTTEVTHLLENLLDKIRSHTLVLTQEHIDILLFSKDVVSAQLDAYRNEQEPDPEMVELAKAKIESLSLEEHTANEAIPPVPAPVKPPEIVHTVSTNESAATKEPTENTFRIELLKIKAKDIENLKTELALLGSVESVENESNQTIFNLITTDSSDSIMSICSFVVDESDLIITEISGNGAISTASKTSPTAETSVTQVAAKEIKIPEVDESSVILESSEQSTAPVSSPQQKHRSEDKPEASPAAASIDIAHPHHPASAAANNANQQTTSIRVGIEKVDQLINLIGELVITQAMIEQHVNHLEASEHTGLFNSINQLTRNTKDLQEAVMSIRMMPMDYVFSRFPRMVRDLATKLDKKIDFVTEGAATELDKGLIERIIDPLTHLVRNSIDHGIEHPDVRRAAGKRETGRLSLSASNRGGNIVIEVSDDGAGLNRERIMSKARENGLNVSDDMKDSDVWKLIFAPGFSTAEVVTEVSGRGVGMDVVKRNVNSLGGAIQIQSKSGIGTVMSISMPLTLAIMDGMTVGLGENIFILPLNTIVETLQPNEKDIKSVTGEGLMIQVRGEYLPIIALHALFNHETDVKTPTQGVLVIIETEGHKAALLVARLVGQQQVVIKSLQTNFKKIPGISGATIMGDGTVALILDAPEIIELGQHNGPQGIYQ